MAVAEIKAKERELLQEINNDDGLLESALKYVRELKKEKKQPPCQYTASELRDRLKKSREGAKAGIYKTQEEMRRKYSL